jgi:hypothetical protein
VVGAEALVVVGDDALEGLFLGIGIAARCLLFLGQVFLDLLHVGLRPGGEKTQAMFSGTNGIGGLPLGLGLEQVVVLDGVVDGGGGEDGVERRAGGGVVLGQDGLDDGPLGEGLAGLGKAPCRYPPL